MKVKSMAYVGMFAAILAVLGQIAPIPLPFSPTPITLQTLGVMLAGTMLGSRLGTTSILVFLGIIAVGFPGLSGGRGGLEVFVGPTGGYLIGWVVGAFVIGLIIEKAKQKNIYTFFTASIIGGMIIMYAFGIPFQAFITNIGLKETAISSLVYIPGDLIKVILASVLAQRLYNTKAIVLPIKEQTY